VALEVELATVKAHCGDETAKISHSLAQLHASVAGLEHELAEIRTGAEHAELSTGQAELSAALGKVQAELSMGHTATAMHETRLNAVEATVALVQSPADMAGALKDASAAAATAAVAQAAATSHANRVLGRSDGILDGITMEPVIPFCQRQQFYSRSMIGVAYGWRSMRLRLEEYK
jgi:hypothetical protein